MIFSFDSEELRDTLEIYDTIFDKYGVELGEKIILFLDLIRNCKNLDVLNNLLKISNIENFPNMEIDYIVMYKNLSISFYIINSETELRKVNRIKILSVNII